jgi:hypothetical protein
LSNLDRSRLIKSSLSQVSEQFQWRCPGARMVPIT